MNSNTTESPWAAGARRRYAQRECNLLVAELNAVAEGAAIINEDALYDLIIYPWDPDYGNFVSQEGYHEADFYDYFTGSTSGYYFVVAANHEDVLGVVDLVSPFVTIDTARGYVYSVKETEDGGIICKAPIARETCRQLNEFYLSLDYVPSQEDRTGLNASGTEFKI